MKKIIAIGGGEIGRPGYPIETKSIDKEIIKISNKKNPRLLFIPTASSDSEAYFDCVQKYFGKKLSCKVDVLYLLKEKLNRKQAEDKILKADIIYVGGGNTLKMMKIWRKIGLDKILIKAWKRGVVMSGLSAGSICWFDFGQSDFKKFNNPEAGYSKVTGLGFIKALNCPHFDVEKERKNDLRKMLKKIKIPAIALDDCCALEVIDDQYRIISSKLTANAYKLYWKKNKYHQELIEKDKKLKPLKDLLSK